MQFASIKFRLKMFHKWSYGNCFSNKTKKPEEV